jgi:hypothetical protein
MARMSGRTYIDCPRTGSAMTPCIARGGHRALSDPGHPPAVCVGCGVEPAAALASLAERYPPAAGDVGLEDPREAADALTRHVADYVG